MFYDKIKVIDLQAMTLSTGFTPYYTVERYEFETDINTKEQIHYAFNVEIIKTAEQVEQEWKASQNKPIEQPISLEERITQLEVLQVNSMSMQIENKLLGGTV